MPLYEYKCDQCGQVFEILQKFSDAPLKVHPECGGTVGRLMSSPAFQFKGTGWYVTDYGPKNGGSRTGENGGSRTGENGHGSRTGENGGKKPDTSSKPAESKSSTRSDTASQKS
jgi:putative FmdB family regulatory protein